MLLLTQEDQDKALRHVMRLDAQSKEALTIHLNGLIDEAIEAGNLCQDNGAACHLLGKLNAIKSIRDNINQTIAE